ncbi:DegV family protein [Demetria terragena]|uniref:DegV family protein n=1 Tax=Demetria terragena TaxID=63959 RepID=UPI00037252EF|nr:DegV family protein [Demetria terragena]
MLALVTDSTACLSSELVAQNAIRLVRMHLLVDGESYVEGVDMDVTEVTNALREHKWVSTSKPSVGDFIDAYDDLARQGADHILSIHLSAEMSGTVGSAQLAAAEVDVPVEVVDSRSLGMGLGFAVLSAAEILASGGTVTAAAAGARRRADGSSTTFYVDTLDYLRRGGRIGRASAFVGSALAIKPLLVLQDGTVGPLEKVRTSGKALARLEELTVEQVENRGESPEGIDIAVQHLDAADRAEALCDRLIARLGASVDVHLVGLDAVVAAHVGPGTIGTVVSPRVRTLPPTIGATALDG